MRELIAGSRPGDRLPSERELSARWGVARMTVRHAMDTLVAEGLVVRRQGSGTYVAAQPMVRFLGLTSFTQDMRERGLVPASRLLAFGVDPADATLAARLQVPPGERTVSFTRLRLGSGEPDGRRDRLDPGDAGSRPRAQRTSTGRSTSCWRAGTGSPRARPA